MDHAFIIARDPSGCTRSVPMGAIPKEKRSAVPPVPLPIRPLPSPIADRSVVALKEGSAVPTPVDAVASDAWPSQLHDFDQVDLLELRGLAGVLPDQGVPVEHVPACAIPPD